MGIDTSIIITNNNNGPYLDLCLKSIVDNTDLDDKEIIVMSNGCTDNSNEISNKWMKKNDKIVVLTSEQPLGLAMASNAGVSYAQGKWLVMTNEDVVFPSDWETTLLKYRKEKQMICPNVIEPGVNIPVAAGFTKKDFGTTTKDFDYKGFLKFEKSIRTKKRIKATNGLQVLSKRDYMSVGGCDTLFAGITCVDTDFFIKLRLAGITPVRTYESAIYHFSGKSGRLRDINPDLRFFEQVEQRNAKKIFAKWGFYPSVSNGLWTAPKKYIRGVDFSRLA